MLALTSITSFVLLSGITSASPIVKRATYASDCAYSCGSANTAFSTCLKATPVNFNATTDVIASANYLMCSCTNAIALYTATCTSCEFSLGASTATIDTMSLTDGSFLSSFNEGCSAYASAFKQTWTNATYTQSGGLNGAGEVIPSFAVAVTSTGVAPTSAATTTATTTPTTSPAANTAATSSAAVAPAATSAKASGEKVKAGGLAGLVLVGALGLLL